MNKQQQLTIKLQSQTKTKRLREIPKSFKDLADIVEQQIKEERETQVPANGDQSFRSTSTFTSGRDYVIRYVDNDDELINVSDDDDLLTAYDIAEKELKGSLKLTVSFKNQMLQRSMTSTIQTPTPATPRVQEEIKKEVEEEEAKIPVAASNEAARLLSKQALKKAMKEA